MAAGYVLEGVKWGGSSYGTAGGTVTYAFASAGTGSGGNFSGSFDAALTSSYQALVNAAFDAWEAIANIDFQAVSSTSGADIVLGMDYLDGSGDVIGLTNYSYSGKVFGSATVRFDTGDSYTTDASYTGSKYVNFYTTALHEIGHALGLDHVNDQNQIMYAYTTDTLVLGSGDIAGAQYLYGGRAAGSYGTPGNDTFYGTAGDDNFYGQAGVDTVQISGARGSFTVTYNGNVLSVSGQGSDTFHDIERLQFNDGTLAFDTAGTAGQAYRLYTGAFDRTPDTAGLSYYVKSMDSGTALAAVANAFTASAEFASIYGAGASGTGAVAEFYQHILGRTATGAELTYWGNQLATGTTLGQVLVGFTESAENTAKTAAAIAGGIWLTPVVLGTAGNDSFANTGGNDAFYGFAGRDTVEMGGQRAGFAVAVSGTAASVTGAGTDSYNDIERLHFSDGTLAVDIDGAAGQAYRLYRAAFDRTPDTAGLAYQVARLDSGVSLQGVANGFAESAEFANSYGGANTHQAVVEQLYRNVLHRDGEAAGIAYWTQQLDAGVSTGTVLIGFSESAENRAAVAGAIAGGIWLG